MLSHDVFFTLKDSSPEACQALVDACHRHLGVIDGIHFFTAGTRETSFDRDVNDAGFHVALHVVFPDQATHDAYQTAPTHADFITECEANWAQVRVFDSVVSGGAVG
jgi:DNA-binding LacI/PurR family transcriptional regulator